MTFSEAHALDVATPSAVLLAELVPTPWNRAWDM